MFGQLFSARLKAAEKALRESRIDEAYRLAMSDDLRAHKRGQEVLASLSELFYERAREHFHADRFTEALMDLERAKSGGNLDKKIEELTSHIQAVAMEAQRQAASRRDRLNAARQRIEQGSLAAGRELLERASEADPEAQRLIQDADARSDDAFRMVKQAQELIKKGQLAAAAGRIKKAKSLKAHDTTVAGAESALCEKVFGEVRAALLEGRVKRAADELGCLDALGDGLPAKKELEGILGACMGASRAIVAFDHAEARRLAMTVQRLLPKAKWLRETIDRLDRMEENQMALLAGPLGEHAGTAPGTGGEGKAGGSPAGPRLDETIALPDRHLDGGLPNRLLLLVDGGGSFLLVRNSQVSIGRAACDRPADVAILSDIAERHANITRVDDDYFIFASKEVDIAARSVKQKLLRDGDRVVMGAKAKFAFRLPSRKSATAVLDLSDTTKMPQDVRRVILFARHAVIGQGPSSHVVCRHASPALVLFERDGSFWVRQKNDGHVDTKARQLVIGEAMEIGGMNMVLQPWRHRMPGMPLV
ncbi:MAG: FHA domain-containing protein [Planctomycetota bacterium]|jgi:tetratricopeptide (TPR) repeat protein